jgi:hypothetical protein
LDFKKDRASRRALRFYIQCRVSDTFTGFILKGCLVLNSIDAPSLAMWW